MVSFSGTPLFGQCSSNRSISPSRSWPMDSFTERSSKPGARWSGATFVVTNTSLRLIPGGADALTDLALVAVHLRGVEMPIAKTDRLLDRARTFTTAGVPRCRDRGSEYGAFGVEKQHGPSGIPFR